MADFDIKETYLKFLEEDKDMTMPIAAIESLVSMLKAKSPSTSSELINLVSKNIDLLKSSIPNNISLSAGCDLFMRFVLRNTNVYSDWESFHRILLRMENCLFNVLRNQDLNWQNTVFHLSRMTM